MSLASVLASVQFYDTTTLPSFTATPALTTMLNGYTGAMLATPQFKADVISAITLLYSSMSASLTFSHV